ncbi:LysR family transcriptional regulator [Agrobacterium pusense]|jgi:DNA-binding transcriptional LysR family regulator|uniref:LysR family transcriptional regulator n=1 Tax=Agrobacterium pusense TaxID=648995 RepID=UPI0037BE522C
MRIHAPAILYFDAVRRAGSIREGARRLNVASSAVNRQILKLEAEIGAPLFDRRPDGVVLTTVGEMLARHVMVVMQDLERARSDISGLRGARIGQVSVVTVESVCSSLLPRVVLKLREIAPRVRVRVSTMGSNMIPGALESGEADVGIAFSLIRSPDMRQTYMARFKLGAIMAPTHPLGRRSSVSLSACFDYPMIWAGPNLSIARVLEPHFHKIDRRIEPAVISGSIELTRHLAMTPPMIGFEGPIGMESFIENGQLVNIPLDVDRRPLWFELGLYVRSGRSLPAAVDLFLQVAAAELQDREGK